MNAGGPTHSGLIPGVPVTLGTQLYTMPPVGFDTLEANADEIDRYFFGLEAAAGTAPNRAGLPRAQIRLAVDLVHAALCRNYPALAREQVAANITIDNAATLLQLAITQSLPAPPPGHSADAQEGQGTRLGESSGGAFAPP